MTSGLAIDEQGQVWVQTLDGIGVLGLNGDWKSYRLGTYIGPIVADKKGRIWVSRFGELLMFDPDTGWTTYHTLNSGLNDSGVNALV
ncbi:MAG: hypothetical protein DPW09_43680, partial [Anaerolineae bacterium]|nr:hypothetical protein [Anaerolineae bacterium]